MSVLEVAMAEYPVLVMMLWNGTTEQSRGGKRQAFFFPVMSAVGHEAGRQCFSSYSSCLTFEGSPVQLGQSSVYQRASCPAEGRPS